MLGSPLMSLGTGWDRAGTAAPSLPYLAPEAPVQLSDWHVVAALDTLGGTGTAAARPHRARALASYAGCDLLEVHDAAGVLRRVPDAELDPLSRGEVARLVRNLRSPALDLEPVYGNAGADWPVSAGDGALPASCRPVQGQMRALHRRIAARVDAKTSPRAVRREVRWSYQWLLWERLFPAICDPGTLAAVRARHMAGEPSWPGLTIETAFAVLPVVQGGLAAPGRAVLRTGYLFNLPSGQAVRRAVQDRLGIRLPKLPLSALGGPAERGALEFGHLCNATPLVWYIQREAVVHGRGEYLGPLGTTLLAETIGAAVRTDPSGYLAQGWRPEVSSLGPQALEAVAQALLRDRVSAPHLP